MQENKFKSLIQQVRHGIRPVHNFSGSGFAGEPIVLLVNKIIELGIELNASDIHIEPLADKCRLRCRVDGMLIEWRETFPPDVYRKIISRLKVMAGMDTSERLRPADGHIEYMFGGRKTDVRVASIPAKYGEVVVLRLFSATDRLRKIDELDFADGTNEIFRKLIKRPSGMMIVTGPMNSGKTTTLYAALQELNTPETNIATIEDPIELVLPGVNQTETGAKLDFPTGLRALLRMDCDTLLIGEIRDETTAQIAIRAALTGHRIFTTLHAGDAVGAILRLADMGMPPYKIAATLSGIIAQRLVRRLCENCREMYDVASDSDDALLLGGEYREGMKLYRAVGCETCHGTGFRGRIALHEALILDEEMRRAIIAHVDSDALREISRRKTPTLWQDGVQKAAAGLTTVGELRRALYE